MSGHIGRGQEAERLAEDYLVQQGFEVIKRNFRCKLGEIDLIAKSDGALHFIEVKGRWSDLKGGPLEQVTPRKQQKVARVAELYLQRHPLQQGERAYLSVIGVDHSQLPARIQWAPDAFNQSA